MAIRVLGNQNITSNYTHTNKTKTSANSFASTLNDKLNNKSRIELSHNYGTSPINTNPIYSQSGAIKGYTDYDKEQALIEDKAVYDDFKLKEQGIEFGSKEWEDWKSTFGTGCIPRLNEPWQIRRSWRELRENAKTPEEKKQVALTKILVFANPESMPTENCNLQNRLDTYSNFIKKQNKFYKDVSKIDLGHNYKGHIDVLNKLEEILSKYL